MPNSVICFSSGNIIAFFVACGPSNQTLFLKMFSSLGLGEEVWKDSERLISQWLREKQCNEKVGTGLRVNLKDSSRITITRFLDSSLLSLKSILHIDLSETKIRSCFIPP